MKSTNNCQLSIRLKSYKTVAGTFLALTPTLAFGDVVYTDVNPDTLATNSNPMIELDIDGNGQPDLAVAVYSTTYGGFQIQYAGVYPATGNYVAGNIQILYGSSYIFNAKDFAAGQMLHNGVGWNSVDGSYSYGLLGVNAGIYSAGSWLNETDKYMGLKIQINGSTHFGWVRMDLNQACDQLTVKGFAFEDFPETPIITGDTAATYCDNAGAPVGTDVSDNANGSDLQVTFDKATDETGIFEYRMICVKEQQASSYTLADAAAVPSAQFEPVLPTGNNITANFNPNSMDSDGDLLRMNTQYRVFIYAAPDGTNRTIGSLSNASNQIVLTAPEADLATNIVANDVANFHSGLDLEVQFTKAANENTIDEYRIIVVKSAVAGSFDLLQAESLTGNTFFAVAPSGSNIQTVLEAGTTDSDGQLISEGVPYKVFVLSMADGTNAVVNSLSIESNEIELVANTAIAENLWYEIHLSTTGNQVDVEIPAGLKNANLQVVALNGKQVRSQQLQTGSNRVALAGLSGGIYIARVTVDHETIVSRKIWINK